MSENTDEWHGVECAACIAKTRAFRKDARPDKSGDIFCRRHDGPMFQARIGRLRKLSP